MVATRTQGKGRPGAPARQDPERGRQDGLRRDLVYPGGPRSPSGFASQPRPGLFRGPTAASSAMRSSDRSLAGCHGGPRCRPRLGVGWWVAPRDGATAPVWRAAVRDGSEEDGLIRFKAPLFLPAYYFSLLFGTGHDSSHHGDRPVLTESLFRREFLTLRRQLGPPKSVPRVQAHKVWSPVCRSRLSRREGGGGQVRGKW